MIVTSFNWLSFRGDSGRKYRQEEGTLIRHKEYVDAEYERHRARIESTLSWSWARWPAASRSATPRA